MSSDKNQSGFIKKAERRAKLEKLVAAANNKAELKAQVKSCDKSNTKKTEKKRKRNEKEEFFSTSSSNSSLNIIKQDTEKNGYSKKKKKNDAVTNDMDDSSKKDKGKEMELNGKEKKKNKKHKIRRTIKFSEKGKVATYDDDSVFEPKMKNTSTGNSSTDSAVVDEFYKKNEIQITGDLVFNPIMSFTQLNIDESIKGILNKFERPTPIQASCWPICLSGRDVIGIAETGSVYVK